MAESSDPAGRFGIAPGNHARLLRALEGCAGLDRVWIFGSRARGQASHESDIDLAVDSAAMKASAVNRLRSQIDDLGLVYRIDIVWLQDRIDALLRREIDSCKQLFWQRPAPQAAVMLNPASTVTLAVTGCTVNRRPMACNTLTTVAKLGLPPTESDL